MSEYNDTNQGLGSVYDTPDQKEIARLDRKLTLAQERIKTLEEAEKVASILKESWGRMDDGDNRWQHLVELLLTKEEYRIIREALQSPPSQE